MAAGQKEWAADDGMRRLDLIGSPFRDESPSQGQIVSRHGSQRGQQTKGMSVPKIKGGESSGDFSEAAAAVIRSDGCMQEKTHDGQDERKEAGAMSPFFRWGGKRVKAGG